MDEWKCGEYTVPKFTVLLRLSFFFFDLDVCFFLAFSLMQFFVTFSEIHLFLLATRKFILILFGTHINIEVLRTMAAATKK